MNTTESRRDLNIQSGCGLSNKHFGGMDAWRLQWVKPPMEIPRNLGSFKKWDLEKWEDSIPIIRPTCSFGKDPGRSLLCSSHSLALGHKDTVTIQHPKTDRRQFPPLEGSRTEHPPERTNPSVRLEHDMPLLVCVKVPQKASGPPTQ